MRSFTSYLKQSIRLEWKEHYLDYISLKNVLVSFAERRNNITNDTKIESIERFYPEAEEFNKKPNNAFGDFNLMTPSEELERTYNQNKTIKNYIAKLERDEFCYMLDKEIKKIASLYRQQLTELKSGIEQLQIEIDQATAGGTAIDETGGLFQTFLEKFKTIGEEMLELHAFAGTNITALRQILIRYDSLIRTLDGPPLGQWYIITRREVFIDGDFEAIFVRHGLFLLNDAFSYALKDLKAMSRHIQEETANEIDKAIEQYLSQVNSDISQMESAILTAENTVDKAFRSRLALTDSIVYSLRYFFLAGTAMNELVMHHSYIKTRGLKLKDEMRFFAKWRTARHETLPESSSNLRDLLNASMSLNFASQFLYMMNYYIIEPSSTQYVHALGGRDALSGLLIGMTPWAGLVSAFVYSYWSNRSFREPLICSGVFLTLGSFLYANALRFDSLTMAMTGRFMTGLGAPCGLNVRFIADTVKTANRTATSALLVTVSAMGMSFGPFCAVLLDFVDIDIDVPVIGSLYLNGMTGPGYLMFILWAIYLCFFLAYYKESARIGLMEIEQKINEKRYQHYKAPFLQNSTSIESNDSYDDTYQSSDEDDNLEAEEEDVNGKLRYINEATVICMCLKFIGKLIIELLGCSVSLITRHRYDWSVKNIGTLSFVNGLLVIPISTAVGYLSQHYTDITMLYWLLGLGMLGLFLLFDVTDFGANPQEDGYYDNESSYGYNNEAKFAVHQWRYIMGIILEFCGFQASQSVVLSMLSKVVPLSLARGTFNSGFMATTISTLARANGDILITVMGLVSTRELLNLLVVPSILMGAFCLMISFFHKHKLSV